MGDFNAIADCFMRGRKLPKGLLLTVDALCREQRHLVGNGTMLEIGCGTGLLIEFLNQQGNKVFGLDSSYAMLLKAQKRGIKGISLSADACHIPMKDLCLNGVIMVHVARHLGASLTDSLKEVYRVTKGHGFLLIYELGMSDLIERPMWKLFPGLIDRTATKVRTITNIMDYIKRAGFNWARKLRVCVERIEVPTLDYFKSVYNKAYTDLHDYSDEEFEAALMYFREDLFRLYPNLVRYAATYTVYIGTKSANLLRTFLHTLDPLRIDD